MLQVILSRLKEPSTYAGLGVLAAALNIPLPNDAIGYLIQIFVGSAGVASVFLPEKK